MYSIRRESSGYVIYHKSMNLVLDRFDNQRDTLERFNTMMITLAVDTRISLSTAEIIFLDEDVIVVGNMLGDRVYTILSPIFDNVIEANEFLETTICSCGFDVALREPYSGGLYCDECFAELER